MPGGQPTKYHDGIPELFIEAMCRGDSITQFAAQQDVCYDTVHEWSKVHPEFSRAYTRGRAKGEAFWTHWLTSNMDNPKANGALVKLYFANRFGWSDKKDVTQTTTHKLSPENVTELEQAKKAHEKPE